MKVGGGIPIRGLISGTLILPTFILPSETPDLEPCAHEGPLGLYSLSRAVACSLRLLLLSTTLYLVWNLGILPRLPAILLMPPLNPKP